MASIATRIQEAAPRNQELVAILEATDHAPPTLEHQKQYVADLDRDLSDLRKRISSLEMKREKELKEHEKYRDSVMKRFAYKVARKQDKFEARASKEEQEYLQVSAERCNPMWPGCIRSIRSPLPPSYIGSSRGAQGQAAGGER